MQISFIKFKLSLLYFVTCSDNKADIVFLLDASSSEGIQDFKQQLEFVKNFTKVFNIGKDHVQIGLLTFSTSPHNAFNLKDYQNATSLLNAIDHVQKIAGGTSTDEALKYVRQHSFKPENGGRNGVPRIVIVLTDGNSASPTRTATEAKILHLSGIKVISVGIGHDVSLTELQSIATDHAHAFAVGSFGVLNTIVTELQETACTSEKLQCDTDVADIVFLLDASSSEGSENFQKQLDFVSGMTKQLTIGPNNVQISVVTFSDSTYNQFYLNTYSNEQDILQAIRNVTYNQGTTNTGDALKFIREKSFLSENGGRDAVTQLVIVLTDGNSQNQTHTAAEAKLLHDKTIKVITIGIGSSIGITELQSIASDNRYVYNVTSFDALHTILLDVLGQTCKVNSGCGGQADIVFILDSSSSEGSANFHKMLDFVTNFANQFSVGPNDVQIGLVTFSTYARNEFYLNSYSDKMDLISKLQTVAYIGGNTATYMGLQYAHNYQFKPQHGARANATHIAIVMTDGQSNDMSRTITEAHGLQQSGVKVISVGIGSDLNQYELGNIASNRNDVHTVGSFDILHTIQADLKETACGNKPEPTENPECGSTPADIVFVLDSSGSEGTTNFKKQLDFVRDFAYQFQIGPQNVQISVVTFGSHAKEEFPLNRYQDQTALLSAISRIVYHSGTTQTDEALAYVRTNSFLSSHGGRENATNIVVVITDGQSTEPAKTKVQAELLKHQNNTKVIAIGIGSGIVHSELETIATDHAHALAIADFNALQQIKSELTYAACQTCRSTQKADIVFLLDASSSEGDSNFQKQLDFVSRVVNDFSIGKNQVQVSMVTFSNTPRNEFYLNSYANKAQLLSQIQKVSYMQGGTNTDQALEFVGQTSFAANHGARDDAPNFLIVLTDGASANTNNTLTAAQHLKAQGIHIISIGVGSQINKDEINEMEFKGACVHDM
ncbi:hypothetical protein ACJMK2_038010 [Sinanodonta woodiana]|uniref:VWFA domain-containing protein n=1 Tax=Sinanodonta woodiana TaxID=1069815 RepID=A0ABD3WM68_SINWO